MATNKEAAFIRTAIEKQARYVGIVTTIISWIPDIAIACPDNKRT